VRNIHNHFSNFEQEKTAVIQSDKVLPPSLPM